MNRSGKVDKEWQRTRRLWIKNNPPNHEGYYICALCGRWVPADEAEIDHIISRGRDPSLRAEQENLQPTHSKCNRKKGSR